MEIDIQNELNNKNLEVEKEQKSFFISKILEIEDFFQYYYS